MTLEERQLLFSGHWSFFRQLHVFSEIVAVLVLMIFLLCLLIIYSFHVFRAAVTYFDVVLVEDFGVICDAWGSVFL
jgi:hypothetical protein